jgi:predicted nucleic acid-binding protein
VSREDKPTRPDWTLDTWVLVTANGQGKEEPPALARQLLECVKEHGYLVLSTPALQEYISTGAASPRTVAGQWLASLQTLGRVIPLKPERLTPSDVQRLQRIGRFRDPSDLKFIELARASERKRLVTEDAHYNAATDRLLRSRFHVRRLDLATGVDECKQEAQKSQE